jgi:hypothetical protein
VLKYLRQSRGKIAAKVIAGRGNSRGNSRGKPECCLPRLCRDFAAKLAEL